VQDNPTLISEVAFEVSDSTDAPINDLVPCETHATEIVEDFTKADDFYDDNGPVFDLLFERVSSGFRKLRSELPFILRFKKLIAARPHNPQTHKLTTPFHGCYSWEEICVDLLHRDSSTVRKLFIDVKSPSQLAAEKAARIHTQHVVQNAAALAQPTVTDTAGNILSAELTAKVLAQMAIADEAVAGRNVAVETARNDGFADGVSTQQAFDEKQAASAGTLTKSFYALVHKNHATDSTDFFCESESLAQVQKIQNGKRKFANFVAVKVDATYTVTPCELPPTPPSPTKKSKKKSAIESPAVVVQS